MTLSDSLKTVLIEQINTTYKRNHSNPHYYLAEDSMGVNEMCVHMILSILMKYGFELK